MAEFLVEVYVANASDASQLPGVEDVIEATESVASGSVTLLRRIYVPDDETCFYLFEAQSQDGVIDAATRAGIRIDRMAEAASDLPARLAPRHDQ